MSESYLILGGAGFIGRNLVEHLLECGAPASCIRVVDKVIPRTAWLNKHHLAALAKVEFRQANLAMPDAIKRAFEKPDGSRWDFVINLAAETKLSLFSDVYDQCVRGISVNCGKEAAKHGARVFIEFSTAQVYSGDQLGNSESSSTKPWTNFAKAKLEAEKELSKIEGLNLVILRPAIVYGPGDTMGITPRLILGRIYKKIDEEMRLLWNKDLHINTVHVIDVCRAVRSLCLHFKDIAACAKVFNVVDQGKSTQETIEKHVQAIFGVETVYEGDEMSHAMVPNLAAVADEVNDTHIEPWAQLLQDSSIPNSPLSPYLDVELLYKNNLSADGSYITKTIGFEYTVPIVTEDKLREVINLFQEQGIWPKD